MSLSKKITESLDRNKLEKLQMKLFQKSINCGKLKNKIENSDVSRIPFSDKIVDYSDINENMVKKNLSRNHLKLWFETISRNLFASTINKDDTVQIAYSSESQIGFGFRNGLIKIGARHFFVSAQEPQCQIDKLMQNKTTALISSSSLAMQIIEKIKDSKMDINKLSVKKGLFCIDSYPEDMRINIMLNSDISTFFFLSSPEIYAPCIASECLCKTGLHVNENLLYAEIINPVTGRILENGIKGELVLTTLGKMKFPLIRYRTKIMASIEKSRCSCNRSTSRIVL
jgi:phenylacetate-CoA ligase